MLRQLKRSGTANIMVGKKSGTALAGPAAPATTALLYLIEAWRTISET